MDNPESKKFGVQPELFLIPTQTVAAKEINANCQKGK